MLNKLDNIYVTVFKESKFNLFYIIWHKRNADVGTIYLYINHIDTCSCKQRPPAADYVLANLHAGSLINVKSIV